MTGRWPLERSLSRFVKPTEKRQVQHDKGGHVSGRRRGRIPHEPRFKTANEKWKAQWDDLLAWSTVLAVALHAAAFAFWPSWDTLDLWLEPDLELLETGTAWIPFYAEPMSGGSGGDDRGGDDRGADDSIRTTRPPSRFANPTVPRRGPQNPPSAP